MRSAVWALLVLAWCAAGAAGQQNWAEKMFKDGASHDFGNVPHGAQLLHRFPMTNIYAVPLTITSVQSGCHCGTVTASATTLQPGEKAFIDVTVDARKFTGPKSIKISVSVGPQYLSTAELKVTANSRADIVYNPGQISFGVVPRGETPTQTLDIEYAGTFDWRVSEVVAKDAPATLTFKELYRRPGQIGYQVSATLKADAPAGPLKHEVFLKTNDPASPLVPVLIEATVQAAVSVRPESLSFGTFKAGEPVTLRLQVRGIKPFRITAIDGLEDGLAAEIPPAAAAVHTLTIKYQAAKPGELKRQLKIKTDVEDAPLIVPVDGTATP